MNDEERNEIQEAAPASQPALQPNQTKSGMRFVWPAVSVILLVALIVMIIRDTADSGMDGVVAEGEGFTITRAELHEELLKQFEQMGYPPAQLVDSMITDRLVKAEIAKAGVDVTDAELDAEIDGLIESFGSRENFEFALAQYGYTEASLKVEIKIQLQLEKIIEQMIDADEETVRAYYEDNRDLFANSPEQVRASHILLATQEEAESVLKQLNNGADFAELAGALSLDPGSNGQGGDLGWFERGIMHAEFEDAAFTLAAGETSGVVESPSGFHVIRVMDKKAADVPPYDEIQEEVKSAYMSEQMQIKTTEWLEQIKADSNVKNYLQEE